MDLRFLGFLCLSFLVIGCPVVEETQTDDAEEETETHETKPPQPSLPNDKPSDKKEKPSTNEDEGFDPCPSDTYTFEFDDGTVMVFEIEVFCDPRPYINMGCPEPGV